MPCCDQSTHDCPCKCYKAETPCMSKACQAAGGVCLLPGEPGKVGYGHRPGDWCDTSCIIREHSSTPPPRPAPCLAGGEVRSTPCRKGKPQQRTVDQSALHFNHLRLNSSILRGPGRGPGATIVQPPSSGLATSVPSPSLFSSFWDKHTWLPFQTCSQAAADRSSINKLGVCR